MTASEIRCAGITTGCKKVLATVLASLPAPLPNLGAKQCRNCDLYSMMKFSAELLTVYFYAEVQGQERLPTPTDPTLHAYFSSGECEWHRAIRITNTYHSNVLFQRHRSLQPHRTFLNILE